MTKELFRIGPFALHWYAVIIMTGAILAAYLSHKEAIKKGFPKDYITDLLFYAFPIGIVGARIYYVVFSWSDYQDNLWRVFAIWEGGIAIYGGLLAGLAVVIYYSKQFHASPWITLDIITPTVLLAQGIGRWGNFVNQEAYGEAVSRAYLEAQHIPAFIIDNMYINGTYYQPTFLYESVLSFLGFAVIMLLRAKWKALKLGDVTLLYIVWYGLERFLVEGLRSDSLYWGSVRVSQALALVLVVLSGIIYLYKRRYIKQTYASYRYAV